MEANLAATPIAEEVNREAKLGENSTMDFERVGTYYNLASTFTTSTEGRMNIKPTTFSTSPSWIVTVPYRLSFTYQEKLTRCTPKGPFGYPIYLKNYTRGSN